MSQTSYNLPRVTQAMLEALAEHWTPERPNKTAALIRAVREAHQGAGLPEPDVSDAPKATKKRAVATGKTKR